MWLDGNNGNMDWWVVTCGGRNRNNSTSLALSWTIFFLLHILPYIYLNCFDPLLHSSLNSQVLRWNLPEPYLSCIPTQSPLLFHSLINPKNLNLLVTGLTLLPSPMATTTSFPGVRIHVPSSTGIDRTTLFAQPSVSLNSFSKPRTTTLRSLKLRSRSNDVLLLARTGDRFGGKSSRSFVVRCDASSNGRVNSY